MPTREPPPSCPHEFIALAQRLADAAGEVARAHFRSSRPFEIKADKSPVTAADRDAEKAMRRLIGEAYPDHGVLGEEFGAEGVDRDYVWVLDPIDGTRSFVTGRPLFGILVALAHRGVPILGLIDQPITGERWLGAAGIPSTLNGKPVQVRSCSELSRAVLYAAAPEWFKDADEAAFLRLRSEVQMCLYDADCYAFALLATGLVDLAIECALKPYDYCALVPVVEGAGGVITDWRGRALGLEGEGTVLAAGDRALHQAALELLAR